MKWPFARRDPDIALRSRIRKLEQEAQDLRSLLGTERELSYNARCTANLLRERLGSACLFVRGVLVAGNTSAVKCDKRMVVYLDYDDRLFGGLPPDPCIIEEFVIKAIQSAAPQEAQ